MERSLERAVSLLSILNARDDYTLSLNNMAERLGCTADQVSCLVENIRLFDDLLKIKDDVITLTRRLDLLDSGLLYHKSLGRGRSFVIDVVDSTNLEFVRNKDNAVNGDFLVAEIQTKGRGRYDHVWHTSIGSDLTLSGAFSFKKIKDTFGLSLVAAVTICRVLESYGLEVALKWPNDVYVKGHKISGILIESVPRRKDILAIIGIGLNVYSKSYKDDKINATALDAFLHSKGYELKDASGRILNRTEIAADLINKLKKYVKRFEEEGMPFFLKVYKKHDYLLSRHISIKSGDMILQGRACGLSTRGYLLLKDENAQIVEVKSGHILQID